MGKLIKILSFLLLFLMILSCEQSVYTGPPDEPVVKNRKIFVQSNPSHATIYLDGKNSGLQTPDTIRWIQAEKSTITLKLPLYSDTSIHVFVPDGRTNFIYVDFTKNSNNYGKIYCNSGPMSAKIWLNDLLTGLNTPTTINTLTPGSYKVKFTMDQHRPDSTNVVVRSSTTANVYLTLEDTSKWVSYNKKNSQVLSNYISAIVCDKLNRIWIGTDIGLMNFDGKKFENYTKANSPFQSDFITSIAVDDQNRKWIGTANGLMVFDKGVWISQSAGLPDPHVTSILFDHSGNTWIGTYNGVAKYSNGKWTTFDTTNSGLKDNFITCLAVDSHDKIWIGYRRSGVSVFDGKSWINYNTSDLHSKYLTLEFVQAIACDNKDRVWVSAMNPTADHSHTLIYDGTSWSEFLKGPALTYTMLSYGHYVLLGSQLELIILDTDTGVYTSYYRYANSALPLFKIQTLTMDNTNNIWLGTFMNGIGKLKR